MGEKRITIDKDEAFFARREHVRTNLHTLPGNYAENSEGRAVFFDAVYDQAEGDTAAVPWADCAPKEHLTHWLSQNPGEGKTALDIACGLGDNAEAMANAHYKTTAFDVVKTAIHWAKSRFPTSNVRYQVRDLFALPEEWQGAFNLVHECYTLQALPESMVQQSYKAICNLVAPDGTLLIYTRYRTDVTTAKGPPWPLEERLLSLPEQFGFSLEYSEAFSLEKGERTVPHRFDVWKKT